MKDMTDEELAIARQQLKVETFFPRYGMWPISKTDKELIDKYRTFTIELVRRREKQAPTRIPEGTWKPTEQG
jgi:hypothetical protein